MANDKKKDKKLYGKLPGGRRLQFRPRGMGEGPKMKRQTVLGAITGERGKKVKPHKGRKCPGNQVYNQKLKKCVAQSGPAREAYKRHRSRILPKTEERRMEQGVHGLFSGKK
jgi:hypothetical protein